ncbi:MAG: cobyrinate a,c-diamide synthase [Cocleimonas sp.]|nr:cobyrinate a,c-diamide synthase [Cocleimonas sp.]
MSRIYISAAHKSSGKTTLSIGLCAAFHQQGLIVQPFKKGPDYIDPLWLSKASGRHCHNLDFNTQSHDEILSTLQYYGQGADINIIEGNLGLYDGMALDGADSNAAVAKLTKSPVVLVIDTRGVTRGVAPLLLGYQQFDKDIDIAGVIYNMSNGGRHETKLRAITEEYTDIPVLGVVKKNPLMVVDERHLGLMPSNESKVASQKIADIAEIVADSVNLEVLMEVANSAEKLENIEPLNLNNIETSKKLRLGICEDSAFGFYYAGDKLALEQAGAELISFSPLDDEKLPDNLDGLFIGGGFPETHMNQLAENVSMRMSIHNAIENGLPTYAECGGLMYLSQNLYWNKQSAPMVGIIPADTQMHDKPQGRGYVKLEETSAMLWDTQDRGDIDQKNSETKDPIINAHEFHYSRLENTDEMKKKGIFAYKVHRGVGITGEHDGWVYKNLLANYSHMRDTKSFHWASRFMGFVRNISDKSKISNE